MPDRPVIIAGRRTPIAPRGGRLRGRTAAELAAAAIGAVVDDGRARLGAAPRIDDVVLGNCTGPGGNLARVAALAAGLPHQAPAMTVDRQCGAGLAAIVTAAAALRPGGAVIAGGVESASTAPVRLGADGAPFARAPFAPPGLDVDMSEAAQRLAVLRGIDRNRQQALAARSHRLARAAAETIRAELVEIDGVEADDGPRAGIDRILPRLPALLPELADDPALAITAGTTARIADGAAAVLLVPSSERRGAPGLALRASAVVGVDPRLPGLGPVPAVRAALERGGAALADLAAIELVEAYGAQALAVLDELGIAAPGREPDPRVNADGGALALGHPWGRERGGRRRAALRPARARRRARRRPRSRDRGDRRRPGHRGGRRGGAMSGGDGIIELRGVDVELDGASVLREVDCRLDARSIAVIGPNGSGKSTFARLLAGLVAPTRGAVRVHGIDPVAEERALRERVGFVFSNPSAQLVMPTVREDLAFGLRGRRRDGRRLARAEIDERVDAALAASPLAGRGDQGAFSLSGGQQQLLALMGVLITEPALVIADEPTALLDLVNTRTIARILLEEMAARLVLVTHDLELARRCELAVRFEGGRLVHLGEPEAVVAGYLASVPS